MKQFNCMPAPSRPLKPQPGDEDFNLHGLSLQGKGIAWVGKKAWKHFPGRKVEVPKKQSILERADAAHSEYDYVQLADGRLVAVNAAGERTWDAVHLCTLDSTLARILFHIDQCRLPLAAHLLLSNRCFWQA